jgi:tRNA threonylcarbamoyladenosine biosynthesis protein TsaB
MALILSIETSTPICSVALHDQGQLMDKRNQMFGSSHSEILAPTIQDLLNKNGCQVDQLSAVVVSGGPGSYTGLRIGTSTAKGLCYAAGIPLISVSTLASMSFQAIREHPDTAYYCSMLDARRMEVYCMITDEKGDVIQDIRPMIITPDSFNQFNEKAFCYFGYGAEKCRDVFRDRRFRFVPGILPDSDWLGQAGYARYREQKFVDLAYYEPRYLKEFQAKKPKQLL